MTQKPSLNCFEPNTRRVSFPGNSSAVPSTSAWALPETQPCCRGDWNGWMPHLANAWGAAESESKGQGMTSRVSGEPVPCHSHKPLGVKVFLAGSSHYFQLAQSAPLPLDYTPPLLCRQARLPAVLFDLQFQALAE